MQPRSGTYALVMRCFSQQHVEVGKLGRLHLRPGFCVYVGSAFGSGGLRARINHHLKISENPHWHIDYLRLILNITEVWYSYGSEQQEHLWAETFSCLKGASMPLPGFGASDCCCNSHLFIFTRKPSVRLFSDMLGSQLNGYQKQAAHVRVDSSPGHQLKGDTQADAQNPKL